MCSTPKMPSVDNKQPEIQAPTYADAEVTKASEQTRSSVMANANKNVKTSSRGLGDEANKKKKSLLGE